VSRSVALAVPAASLASSAQRPRARAIYSLRHDPATLLGAALCLTILLLAVFAEQLAPRDPARLDVPVRLQGPSATYLLGTDELGRDVLSRVIHGARVSLAVAGIAVSIASAIGVLLGLCAGYYGGIADSFIMRGLDGLLAFPSVILALAIMAVFGTTLVNAMIAIGIVSIPGFARIIRGSILSLKGQEFVEAARVCGATDGYLMRRVLLPHCLSPLLVQVSISFASAILVEAALSFLGLGVQPPTPSWGAMLDTGRKYLDQTPWYSASAGAAIFLTALGLNLLGDGLRDALDPRLHGRA
jgi:peptide/nickel transport system permease protein